MVLINCVSICAYMIQWDLVHDIVIGMSEVGVASERNDHHADTLTTYVILCQNMVCRGINTLSGNINTPLLRKIS